MKKLETIIYIVGPKRSWEFQARHVKRIFLFILLVILGLGGTIGYQEYDHLQALKKADEKLDQENLKNEKGTEELNDIHVESGISMNQLLGVILELELKGIVQQNNSSTYLIKEEIVLQ